MRGRLARPEDKKELLEYGCQKLKERDSGPQQHCEDFVASFQFAWVILKKIIHYTPFRTNCVDIVSLFRILFQFHLSIWCLNV